MPGFGLRQSHRSTSDAISAGSPLRVVHAHLDGGDAHAVSARVAPPARRSFGARRRPRTAPSPGPAGCVAMAEHEARVSEGAHPVDGAGQQA